MKTKKNWFLISRWTENATLRDFKSKGEVKYGTDKDLLTQMSHENFRDPFFNGMEITELKGNGKEVDRSDLVKKYFKERTLVKQYFKRKGYIS